MKILQCLINLLFRDKGSPAQRVGRKGVEDEYASKNVSQHAMQILFRLQCHKSEKATEDAQSSLVGWKGVMCRALTNSTYPPSQNASFMLPERLA